MSKTGLGLVLVTALVCLSMVAGCAKGSPVDTTVQSIFFETQAIPSGGAGQLYNQVIAFRTEGGAAMPDRFELESGVLPPGVTLMRDREDNDLDGLPDEDGAYTGEARLLGYPREAGSYTFAIQAISTGALSGLTQNLDQPDLAATQNFTMQVGEGSINIMNPTAEEGTSDPAIPAFPDVIDFVNPANPSAFFSFPFLVAGGSGHNLLNVYLPRELELSVFDVDVVNGVVTLDTDTDETAGSGDKFENDFSDGGLFVLQAGEKKVQIGGFQSPRGVVGAITKYAGGPGLDPDWFQSAGVPLNSRRDLADTEGLASGDNTLGTPLPVRFSDYFDANYEGTHPSYTPPPGSGLQRRKYPFPSTEYQNAFFLPFVDGVHLTPLRYNAIVEAIDTRGTPGKSDDIIFRKAYHVQVRIPDIVIDTVVLPAGQAGVDYNEFVNASGGVPPLQFDLEWTDGTQDLQATSGDPLTKDLFGLEVDPDTGQFFGVPRSASDVTPSIELTVRVYAAVMNPTQNGAAFIPTGNTGEYDGTHPLTGKAGRHKTLQVYFALPSTPVVANTSLVPGVDGNAYPGDQIAGTGGVPQLIPYPVGFTGTYPSSQAARNYDWTTTYVRDASHGVNEGVPDNGLPNSLVLDGDRMSPTCGQISGTAYDRGFHPVTINGLDVYVGDAGNPSATTYRKAFSTVLALSISPDEVVYMRGLQASEGTGGEPSGLLDKSGQMAEQRMVPMFFAASLYTLATGSQPQVYGDIPPQVDLLPVMLANGGNDAHNRKSIPSISGFWPAESNRERDWNYGYQNRAWQHLQQEMCWAQTNNPSHHRVYLWGETKIKKYVSGASTGGYSKRYQQYDVSAGSKRGVLIGDPLTGDFWVPAILENDGDPDVGTQFAGEAVLQRDDASYPSYYQYGTGYWKEYYYGKRDTRWDREVHLQGLGSYIENSSSYSSSQGWYRSNQGRTATSIAMSADGIWCAAVMPGGSEQKLLLWRTDKQPIPASILSQSYVTALDGKYKDGTTFSDSACIFNLGGESASGTTIPTNQRYLLPDSIMFVKDGLLFLMESQLDKVFALSLADGHLSSVDLNSDPVQVNGAGYYPYTIYGSRGQYIPDQDYLRGFSAQAMFSVQFAFTGDKPDPGETGPDSVAFIAGDNYSTTYWTDLSAQPRDGYFQRGNDYKGLFFLDLSGASGPAGLDLQSAALRDLTGSDSRVYGDLTTPGRPGEELDYLTVSPDGKYAAIVRDYDTSAYTSSFSFYMSTFATYNYSSSSWAKNDDLMIASTDGSDMDSGTSGTQHILYVGSHSYSNNTSTDPSMPTYASGKSYLNARYRRINGLFFSEDSRTLIFNYSATSGSYSNGVYGYNPNYVGISGPGWAVNPTSTGTFGFGTQQSIRLSFRTGTGAAVDFKDTTKAASFMKNSLQGLTGKTALGDTSLPYGDTRSSDQLFWATFKSANGKFLYYVSDRLTTTNFMVGFNISNTTINGHAVWAPFSPHASGVGFEQFDCNSWNYENRFCAVPAGVEYKGRDGAGILAIIASDASAGASSATDLEVYVMDADIGGNMIAVTPDVTDGSANAINYLYMSADGNVLVGQRAKTTTTSRDSRAILTTKTDLFAVTNLHEVLAGGTPNDFVISSDKSHGASVAFIGEGTASGPQAVVYSAAPSTQGTQSWDDRQLYVGLLAPGATPNLIDSTKSHYAVLVAGRKLDDNANGSD